MSSLERFIGLQVRDLIFRHNTNPWRGFRIYRLQGEKDTTGKLIVEDMTIRSACSRRPSIAQARIIQAEDYYGTIILRVREERK